MKKEKLVRDKIPALLKREGTPHSMRIAPKKERLKLLRRKLWEEVKEFKKNSTVEELADILEVIRAFEKHSEYKNVEQVRSKKFSNKGGFRKFIVVKFKKEKTL